MQMAVAAWAGLAIGICACEGSTTPGAAAGPGHVTGADVGGTIGGGADAEPAAGTDAGASGNGVANFALSGTRLKVRILKSADGAMTPWGFFDSALGTDCSALTATDGQLRCLPLGASTGQFFADASCTIPAAIGPSGTKFATVGSTTPAGCALGTTSFAIYKTGDAVAVASLFQKSADKCAPIDSSYSKIYGCASAFTVGAEVAPTEFVALSTGTL